MRALIVVFFLVGSMNVIGQFTGSRHCLEMTGAPKYVNVTNSASQTFTTAITVEAWIYATSWGVNAWSNSIVSKEDWASGSRGFVLRCGNGGRLSFNIGVGTSWQEVVTTTSVMNLNQWHHVAGTYNGSQLKIFVDGIEVGSFNLTSSITSSPYDLRIGESAYSQVSSRPFTGRIDEVRLWSVALTSAQIREYMCRNLTSTHPLYANLKGHWRFDEGGTSLTTADASGNNNHGTLTGGPVWVLSGVPIGETSAFSYAAPFQVALDHAQDSISVQNISPVPTAVHIYRIDGQPDNVSLPSGYPLTGLGDGYWGVRIFGSPNATYTFNIKLKQLPATTGCLPVVIRRADNSIINWSITNDYLDLQSYSVTLNSTGRQEFMVYFGRNSVITYSGLTAICAGDSVVLTALTQPGFQYQWLRNNVPVAGATQPTLTVNQTGDYRVMVTNAANCSDTSDTKTITVNPKPNVQITPSGPVSFCDGGQVTLYVSGAASYLWSTTSILDSIVVSQSGKYMVWGADANGCIDSSSQVITVHAHPLPVIALQGPTLTTGNYASYQWFLGNNLLAGATQQTLTPVQNGVYKVEVTDSNGCQGVSANFNMSNVGIDPSDNPDPGIGVFPNPVRGNLATLELILPAPGMVQISLHNLIGQIMVQQEVLLQQGKNEVVMLLDDQVPPGVYICTAIIQGGKFSVRMGVIAD